MITGIASLLCGHPLDTSKCPRRGKARNEERNVDRFVLLLVKVRLQCQPKTSVGGYKNAMHALRCIVRDEKVSRKWRETRGERES